VTAASAGARPRIWDVDPSTLSLVTGALLGRDEVESVMDAFGLLELEARDDTLRLRLLVRCGTPCRLAEQVEGALDRLAGSCDADCERCPMVLLAEWWSRERERISPAERAAFLWRLARDPRPYLEPLRAKVCKDLLAVALELLHAHGRDSRGGAPGRPVHLRVPRAASPGARPPHEH
jgi:hypothetical protein